MKIYFANDSIEFKGEISQSFQGKHIIWVLGVQTWKLPT